MTDAVIVLSGGMDSGVLLAASLERYTRIDALTFDYGSKHAAREIECARALCEKYGVTHTIVALPFLNELFSSSLLESGEAIPEGSYSEENMRSTVVPFRNGIMLSIAIGFAEDRGADVVLIGSHAGDRAVYPDCRSEFTAAFSEAARLGTYRKVTVEAPFATTTKKQIAEIGRKLNFDFASTWSCYKGEAKHCGKCATCIERKGALGWAEGNDPTPYSTPYNG